MARDQSATFLLLTNDSKNFNSNVLELWNTHSGLPGILDESSKYTYNPKNNTYKLTTTGRQVSEREIREAVSKVAEHQKLEMRKATQQLIAGTILASVWYLRMQNLLAVLYKTFWVLTIGGFLFDDDILRNEFYLFVLLQFDRLNNFYEQIVNKSQPLDGTAMNRAGLYASYGNSVFQNANMRAMEMIGFKEAKRVLGKNENHCHDSRGKSGRRKGCIELARKGWMPLGQVVPIGDASCYSNCHCHLVYR